MNSWTVTGTLKSFGIKGTKFKKLWINIEAPTTSSNSKNNSLFINADIPEASKYATKLISNLESGEYSSLLAYDCTVGPIKTAKKKDDGTWEEYYRTGIKTNINRIILSKNVNQEINIGMLVGTITKKSDNKLIIEETYRHPKQGFVTREVPIMLSKEQNFSFILPGNKCFFLASVSSGDDSKVHGYCKTISLV